MNRKTIFDLCLIVSITVFAAILLYFLNPNPFRFPDSYDYAQIARNISRGEGLTTDFVSPLSWSQFPTLENHPSLLRPPLYPILLGCFFKIYGSIHSAYLVVTSLSLLGISTVSYLLIREIGTRRWIAILGALVILSSPPTVNYSSILMTEILYIPIFLASFLIAIQEEQFPILFGFFSGLAYLTRYNHLLVLIPVLGVILLHHSNSRSKYFTLFSTSFLVTISPILTRNLFLLESPFYHLQTYELLGHTASFPANEIYRVFDPPNPLGFLLNNPTEIINKFARNLLKSYLAVPDVIAPVWITILLAFLSVPEDRKKESTSRIEKSLFFFTVLAFAVQTAILVFIKVKARYFGPLLYPLLILGIKGLERVYDRHRPIGIMLAVMVLASNAVLFRAPPSVDGIDSSVFEEVQRRVPDNEPIVTNVPQISAWHADRTSLLVTKFTSMERHYPDYRFVLLSEIPKPLFDRRDLSRLLKNETFLREFKNVKDFEDSRYLLFRRTAAFH